MRAREVFFGTHIQIVVTDRIEHGLQACYARYADRTRGQASNLVSVVEKIKLEMFVQDAS